MGQMLPQAVLGVGVKSPQLWFQAALLTRSGLISLKERGTCLRPPTHTGGTIFQCCHQSHA